MVPASSKIYHVWHVLGHTRRNQCVFLLFMWLITCIILTYFFLILLLSLLKNIDDFDNNIITLIKAYPYRYIYLYVPDASPVGGGTGNDR